MKKMWPRFPYNEHQNIYNDLLIEIIKILDYEMWEKLVDESQECLFMFTYRWFLLNFKRGEGFFTILEFNYNSVLRIWELIWTGEKYITPYYAVIVAFSLLTFYRYPNYFIFRTNTRLAIYKVLPIHITKKILNDTISINFSLIFTNAHKKL
ncbi:hypothetical protein HZS_7612 [Henneguya salminicola]|nr:hypothetical protein HZS_7612 [Henneguya salminicola]